MRQTDVLALLIYCNELDGRHSPNEAKVMAWHEVFAADAHDMTLDFARDVARKHYGTVDAMITPAVFVTKWKRHYEMQAQARAALQSDGGERHCGMRDCMCTHVEPCYRGWMDNPNVHYTVPCPVCRRDLADVLDKISPLGYRSEAEQAMIRLRHRSEV